VLAAIDLDHQLGPVTGEIDDKVADGHLPAETPIRKSLAQQSPKGFLRIRHAFSKSSGALDGAFRGMMLHS
jgi:hypothetical protein